MLMDIDGRLIERPYLWSVYGEKVEAVAGKEEALEQLLTTTTNYRELQEDALMCAFFNMFEAVYDFHRHLGFFPVAWWRIPRAIVSKLMFWSDRRRRDKEYKNTKSRGTDLPTISSAIRGTTGLGNYSTEREASIPNRFRIGSTRSIERRQLPPCLKLNGFSQECTSRKCPKRIWPDYVAPSNNVSGKQSLSVCVGSPSSPTEGLKITVFPGKRHQTRHLDFAFFGC
jgi:hypothetical protein